MRRYQQMQWKWTLTWISLVIDTSMLVTNILMKNKIVALNAWQNCGCIQIENNCKQKYYATQMMEFVFDRVENFIGKGESAG